MTIPDFVPSHAMTIAFAASAALPLLLILLSHGIIKVRSPGRRFLFAFFISSSLAILSAIIWPVDDAAEFIAAICLYLAVALATFTIWTLIAWGFTLTMLLTIADAKSPWNREEWVLAYTGGKPIEQLARDRLGLLFMLRLAERSGDSVRILPGRGTLFAYATRFLRRLFGMPA